VIEELLERQIKFRVLLAAAFIVFAYLWTESLRRAAVEAAVKLAGVVDDDRAAIQAELDRLEREAQPA
jgi:hypothetical protein